MPITGTAPARVFTDAESVNSVYTRTAPKPEVPARVREGANWFFCIVGLVALDSVFTIFGSHLFRFAGLGITAIVDGLASRSQSTAVMHVIVNGWVAGALLFTGYFAKEGQKAAFAVGMAAYAVERCVAGRRPRLRECGIPRFDVSCNFPRIYGVWPIGIATRELHIRSPRRLRIRIQDKD